MEWRELRLAGRVRACPEGGGDSATAPGQPSDPNLLSGFRTSPQAGPSPLPWATCRDAKLDECMPFLTVEILENHLITELTCSISEAAVGLVSINRGKFLNKLFNYRSKLKKDI